MSRPLSADDDFETRREIASEIRNLAIEVSTVYNALSDGIVPRRERIATAALVGLLADKANHGDRNYIAWASVELADALIRELDKEQQS